MKLIRIMTLSFALLLFGVASAQHVLIHEVNQAARMVVDAGDDQFGAINSISVGLPDPVGGGTPPYTYAWSPAEKVKNSSAPLTQPTEFSVTGFILTITDQNNCTASDTVFVDFPTGLEENLEEIKVYPNPAGNYVNIQHLGKEVGDIRIINMEGKQINVPLQHDSGVTLDVSNLTRGVYILQFVQFEKIIQRKIIIQ